MWPNISCQPGCRPFQFAIGLKYFKIRSLDGVGGNAESQGYFQEVNWY